jgi:hypothetical protein
VEPFVVERNGPAFKLPSTSERRLGLRSRNCKRKIWIISIQKPVRRIDLENLSTEPNDDEDVPRLAHLVKERIKVAGKPR